MSGPHRQSSPKNNLKTVRLLRLSLNTKHSTLNEKSPRNYLRTTKELPTTKNIRLLRFTGGCGCPLRGKVFRYAGSVRVRPSLSRQVGNPSGLNNPKNHYSNYNHYNSYNNYNHYNSYTNYSNYNSYTNYNLYNNYNNYRAYSKLYQLPFQ